MEFSIIFLIFLNEGFPNDYGNKDDDNNDDDLSDGGHDPDPLEDAAQVEHPDLVPRQPNLNQPRE